MRPATALHIPQPCHQSWATMTPAAQGRHCAACQKTVVEFTQKTDAEILALLAGAAGGRTCGRFAAGQLGRPLQRAAPAAPMPARWRTWLAAAVALWAVREGVGTAAKAQVPAEWRARYWGGPVPAAPLEEVKKPTEHPDSLRGAQQVIMGDTLVATNAAMPESVAPIAPAMVLWGVVTDASTNERLPGVTVLLKGSQLGTSTGSDGTFELVVPAQFFDEGPRCIKVDFIGYLTQELPLAFKDDGNSQQFQIQLPVSTMGFYEMRVLPPAPWHPRSFYGWGKYWLTRPFRRG